MIFLTDRLEFPEVSNANSNGLLAIGGDLSAGRLLLAYKSGIFPWYNKDEIIQWWSPDPRFVLFPNKLKISKSTKKLLKQEYFQFTENKCFKKVVSHCASASRKGQSGTWITNEMIDAYVILNQKGLAKSFEVWRENLLVGGFYGVDLGDIFCGESMFSIVSNASKCGFTNFVNKYANKYKFIDCQVYSSYLEQLGAMEIPRNKFINYLNSETIKNLHFTQ
ncbi:leucyl/phenylalanyl-tRNA--protein transferase [Apibacter muscae]|uniref:Leucyl/phenylalanyl-tRNA--protein transferase n=1 Tax=Apibacter muscae TaxID=2509004 RepID=A0A563DH18_9FLAO|nr:leucyl/phenylalanyl-tRNA--protein transferase [Apibacter muscae]TWP29311.1 leucyl/phenylalanyl-tRNA--protein transferase [Apibacter muscae]